MLLFSKELSTYVCMCFCWIRHMLPFLSGIPYYDPPLCVHYWKNDDIHIYLDSNVGGENKVRKFSFRLPGFPLSINTVGKKLLTHKMRK